MTTQSKSLRFAVNLSQNPFVWPGGYERYAVTNDGACLCYKCCESEYNNIALTSGRDGWCIIGTDMVYGTGGDDDIEYCAHCGREVGID